MIDEALAGMLREQGHGLALARVWGDSAPRRCMGTGGSGYAPGNCPACKALRVLKNRGGVHFRERAVMD